MRPDARPADLLWRLAVVVAAGFSAAFTAPAWLTTVLVVVASVAVAESLTRHRQLGWVDSLLVGTAGLLVVLVLAGLLLNLLPSGLTSVSWAVAAQSLAFAIVIWGWQRGPSTVFSRATLTRLRRRSLLRDGSLYLAAVVVAVVAIAISVHATDVANRPPVQLSSLQPAPAGQAVVEVSGGPRSGRYELVADDGTAAPRQYGPFTLADGANVRIPIALTGSVRTVVTLRAVDTTRILRSLVLAPATTK